MTTVVGGTYWEECADPSVRWVYGSGARGASILRGVADRFVTVADPRSAETVSAVLSGIEIDVIERSMSLGFSYDTPLSPPRLYRPDDLDRVNLAVADDDVVVYGMVDALASVDCRRAVVDPQHSLSLGSIPELVRCEELYVVANAREIRRLAGCDDLGEAAESVRASLGAAAVVVKGGAAGAVVVSEAGEAGVPALCTPSVFPIGSGDVFTAAFASGVFGGQTPADAAAAASKRTAGYCATRQLGEVRLTADQVLPTPSLASLGDRPSVYIAASFATPAQRWVGRTFAGGLDDVGGRSVYPLRDVGLVADQQVTAAADLAALAGCEAVLIVADEARAGPHFEGGWAVHAGKPIVVFSSDTDPSRFTMLRGSGAVVVDDMATAVYRVIWEALRRREHA
jgi:nucleoside 2-deoxyribosyltransferase